MMAWNENGFHPSIWGARPVNVRALLVSAVFGVTFFAVGQKIYYEPDWLESMLPLDFISTDHMKARAAVRRVLINADSAQFRALRFVAADARYVCGAVRAKDKDGRFADAAFVYDVAVDDARVDDDGRITLERSTYNPCPGTEKGKSDEQLVSVLPGALSIAKNVQKVAPKIEGSSVSTMTGIASSAGGMPADGTMTQQLDQLAGRSTAAAGAVSGGGAGSAAGASSTGEAASLGNKAAGSEVLHNEIEWRGDQPPVAWPTLPSDHPLAKLTRKRTAAEALAVARDVEDRWEKSKSPANARMRPSSEEVREACRALLTIDPKDKDYPRAWASFVRLRKINREMSS